MGVRAKFFCREKDAESGHVTLFPVGEGSDENKEFFRATPNGVIQLHVMNDAATEQFEAGKSYYVDFTPAED